MIPCWLTCFAQVANMKLYLSWFADLKGDEFDDETLSNIFTSLFHILPAKEFKNVKKVGNCIWQSKVIISILFEQNIFKFATCTKHIN